MKNQLFCLFILILASTACDRPEKHTKQDLQRIEAIDTKLNGGNFEAALSETLKYTADYPNCPEGWCLLGWSHAKMNNLEPAKEGFDKAISLNPNQDNAYVGIGVVKRMEGDLQGARAAYSEATRIRPQNAEAFSTPYGDRDS